LKIIFDGSIFMIGRKGRDKALKECPTHRRTPDNGGSTSVDSISYLTLV